MATPVRQHTLGDILVKRGFLSEKAWRELEGEMLDDEQLHARLLEKGLVSESGLAEAIAEQYGLPFTPLTGFRVDPDFFASIPVEWMLRELFVPLERVNGRLGIALADPQNILLLDKLEHHLGQEVDPVVAAASTIRAVLDQSEGNRHVLNQIEAEFKPVLIKEDDSGEGELTLEKISQDEHPVIRLVDTMILNALQKRVSDIHIEPTERHVEIKYRIDGVLYPAMNPLDHGFHAPLTSRLKVMSELDIAEHRVPQDGRFKMRVNRRNVDFRVSILPGAFGEAVVIRILDKEHIAGGVQDLRLERLGVTHEDLRRFQRAIRAPYGMVLVTGPTGSGKTTTLYAALGEINTQEDKIITIEDPVEYQVKGVVQIPVNEKKGLTFARGLRSILRHDPDKIMVGEIRDLETAQIAIQSALTGHLVFTTVHANNAFDVIGRFVNMGIEPYHFVASLNCILAQRLIRGVCQTCAVASRPTRQDCEDSGLTYDLVQDWTWAEGTGCRDCNGLGFRGRYAITEFLDMTDPIKEMILDRRPGSEIRKTAIAEGMTTLRQAALEKVRLGKSTLKEINRVTFIE